MFCEVVVRVWRFPGMEFDHTRIRVAGQVRQKTRLVATCQRTPYSLHLEAETGLRFGGIGRAGSRGGWLRATAKKDGVLARVVSVRDKGLGLGLDLHFAVLVSVGLGLGFGVQGSGLGLGLGVRVHVRVRSSG